jgi:alanine racemase
MLAHNLTPVIHSLSALAELNALACSQNRRVKCHLKIDTGMGRLGVRASAAEIANAILAAPHVEVEGLMTHFASAANYQTGQTESQMALFEATVDFLSEAGLRPALLHLSSSIPVAYSRRAAWRGMVRPGHAIYGYVSPVRGHAPARTIRVKPALSWRATVLSVKDLPAGALVGYGGMFRTPTAMKLAVLAAGYADGIPHRLSNRGSVIVKGKLAPIVGAVSMDLTSIDITNCPCTEVGDAVTLLGTDGDLTIDAQDIAKTAGTISYSVLCGIHARVKRVYV